jgi:PAS domain S-box-containing protein
VVLDAGGLVVAGRGDAEGSGGADGPDVRQDGAALHVRAPATYQGSLVGTVLLGLSLTDVQAAVQESRAGIAAISFAVFVVGLLGVLVVGSLITVPLGRLVTAAERIAAGDLSERVSVGSRDEFGELGSIFNGMVTRLEAAQLGLEESNHDLEVRVRKRTAELHNEVEVRRRAEAAAVASQARFRTVFESSALGIVLFDREGRILTANGAAFGMLPSEPHQMAGQRVCDLLECPAGSEVDRYMAELTGGRRTSFEAEARSRTREGVVGWRRLAGSAVTSEGAFDLGILMIEDTTERRNLEEKLVHAQKLEAVGRLAGGIAHDFNNLLTTINGMAEEAKRDSADSPAVVADLDEILKAGRRAAELTRQLLAFGRRQTLQPKVVDPNEVVQDTTRLLRRLIGEDILLRLELGDTPSVKADPGQLGQVLMNLATNARDAMPNGGELVITTDTLDVDEGAAARLGIESGGLHLRLRVRDNGAGMDETTRLLAFEPFFTTKAVGKGTGLGLATVYGIVRQSGGSITVESSPGGGATFTILLPAVSGPVTVEAPAVAEQTPSIGGDETVLLVEDEETVRLFFTRVLRRAGFRVLEATNGREAIEVATNAEVRIDAIVTDVIMPEMGGIEMIRRIEAYQEDLGVVFVSGYTRNEVFSEDGAMPAQHRFLAKPMTPAELITAVRAVLDERGAAIGV